MDRLLRTLCVLMGVVTGIVVALAGCSATPRAPALRECPDCPELVVVPAGTAIVGAAAADPFHRPDELPERRFVIHEPFAVSRYEITRDQYDAFVRATGRPVRGDCLSDRAHRGVWVIEADTTFRDPGFPQQGDHPAACVSWNEAQAYVDWLNTQTDGGYRLLTEVEWEYVARGGASRNFIYPWGDEIASGCPFANGFDQTTWATYRSMDTSGYRTFDPLPCSDGVLNTSSVGALEPNAFGVYDMIGNVAEWISDCYSTSHEALTDAGTLPDSQEAECTRRVVKGGSWGTLAHNLRTAERVPYAPTHRDDSIGIRVAKTLH